MVASSILKEIEDLHKFLENKEHVPGEEMRMPSAVSPPPPLSIPPATPSPYHNSTINSAERSVDKLGAAIEAAEQEMEAALRRTTEVHRSQLRQKEVELSELQRQLVAKDRCIDGLRDTLATTKHTYEGRLAQLEEALGTKAAQVAALSQESKAAASERQAAVAHLNRAAALHEQEVTQLRAYQAQKAEQQLVLHEQQMAELRSLNAELTQVARVRADEAARAQAAVNAERAEVSRASRDVLELRRQLESLNDKLLVSRVENRGERDSFNAQVEEFKRRLEDSKKRLKAERELRKSCEKWMRSELRSREEMELLLGVVKDATKKDGGSALGPAQLPSAAYAKEDSEIRSLLARLNRMPASSAAVSPTRPALLYDASPPRPVDHPVTATGNGHLPPHTPHSHVADLSSLHKQAAEDNNRLRAELAASKRLMLERLRGY